MELKSVGYEGFLSIAIMKEDGNIKVAQHMVATNSLARWEPTKAIFWNVA